MIIEYFRVTRHLKARTIITFVLLKKTQSGNGMKRAQGPYIIEIQNMISTTFLAHVNSKWLISGLQV